MCPIGAQAQLGLGVSVGGISAGVSVGGDSLVGVEAEVGSGISANADVGGADGLVDADASVGSIDADVNVGGSGNLASVGVTTDSTAPGTPGAPAPGQPSGGTPTGAIPGQPFLDINVIPVTQRRRPASRCSGAGNYDVLNGIAVLDANNTYLGVIVGAYVTGTDLTRVRVSVDPGAAAGGGCVEYTTAGGRATSQGIVINTTQASLQAALSR
ncbi:hypothetical protein [Roseinatronobacter sp. S2]|uniref:hypothetical protein n=1 Tax=Roseinatronobacter sp. S2 TaxID=3035471 RepID=UPI00240EE311|nr:hypothetical protein [Roseinatronobacter sp. S2]WFE76880.1 hypothetical protein P8S53_17705 [Roseinatronobacter sp. S2]